MGKGGATGMSFRWLALALAAVVAMPAAAADSSLEAKLRAEIMPAFEAMQAAANVHDADAHVAFLANDPDLIFVVDGRRIIGWDAVLQQQREWWPDGRIPATSSKEIPYRLVAEPDFIVLDSNSALLSFVLDISKTNAAGVRIDRTMAISQLWRKRPEGWRVTYVHESVSETPSGN